MTTRVRHSPRTAALTGLALAALFAAALTACGGGGARPTIGVKIYEAAPPFEGLFGQWRDLGINTLFVSEALLADPDFRARARADGLRTFLIYPVFQSPEAVKADPRVAAVTASGAPAREEWVEFVCPTHGEDYLEARIRNLRAVVAAGDPDYVSLDFIRFFVFWEKVAPDRTLESLPQTCFCPLCLSLFQKEFAVSIPADLAGTAEQARWVLANHAAEWTEWKCRRIASVVARMAQAAREAKPSVKINIHAVPWRRDDFGGAARSIAGQDLARLAPLVDLISPMTYHHMVRQTPAWVHAVVADMAGQVRGTPILPSIQVSEAYIEAKLSPEEFGAALDEALRPPSQGVVLWSWNALAQSPEKMEILRSKAALKK